MAEKIETEKQEGPTEFQKELRKGNRLFAQIAAKHFFNANTSSDVNFSKDRLTVRMERREGKFESPFISSSGVVYIVTFDIEELKQIKKKIWKYKLTPSSCRKLRAFL